MLRPGTGFVLIFGLAYTVRAEPVKLGPAGFDVLAYEVELAFMVAAYKERRWGKEAYERELELMRARHQVAIDAQFDVPLTFAGDYPSLRLKRAITYSKAALFLARLRQSMGDRPFWLALRRYTRRFSGRVATTRDFERIFRQRTDRDVTGLFETWAHGRTP